MFSPVSDATSLTRNRASAHSMAFISSSSSPPTSLFTSESDVDSRGFLQSSFRAGGPVLCSLPANTVALDHAQRAFLHDMEIEIYRLSDQILDKYALTPSTQDVTGRLSVVRSESIPIPTLLIIMPRQPSPRSEKWREAARELHARILSQFIDLSIEIIDERLLRPAQCFPVERTHPVYSKWRRICHEILRVSNLQQWVGISCWRYGYEEQRRDNAVTIIVSVRESADGPFHTAARRIKGVLAIQSVEDVDVLFIKNEDHLCVDEPNIGPELLVEACTQHVRPGLSIGIQNSSAGSSTMGGIVELRFPGQSVWQRFALTCFHCVYPPEGHRLNLDNIQGARESFRQWEYNPISPGDRMARELLRVEQPSTFDLQNTIMRIKKRINSRRSSEFLELHELAEAIEKGSGGFMIPPDEKAYKSTLRDIRSWEDRRAVFENFLHKESHKLGHVFCGSGIHRQVTVAGGDKRILDWALVQIDTERLPTGDALVDVNKPFPYSPHDADPPTFYSRSPVDPMRFKEILFKTGRTTGTTSGVYNELNQCRLFHEWDPNASGGYRIVPTFTHSVGPKDGKNFCEKGDSGALVYEESGNVVGMFFGATERMNVGYFSLISDIFNDIKTITGACEVRFPVYAG
ncbi:hypothetical protein N7532_010054 [Penicillium argentinense]|uniref:Uncharacterized protein n=1 Tax=Penicillium argentinense TaxID=1131581 RepID=A0A9W9ENV5_9EURO|nr:uncharacterized protein N7532_010054 [Penicillium argentinense]KAJ5085283.1 hypothetical protein N7532_010054 [Penicillium argentinense]